MSIWATIGISILVGILLIGIVRVIFFHKEGLNVFAEVLLLDVFFHVIAAIIEGLGDCH